MDIDCPEFCPEISISVPKTRDICSGHLARARRLRRTGQLSRVPSRDNGLSHRPKNSAAVDLVSRPVDNF